jgi:hypothetical protein
MGTASPIPGAQSPSAGLVALLVQGAAIVVALRAIGARRRRRTTGELLALDRRITAVAAAHAALLAAGNDAPELLRKCAVWIDGARSAVAVALVGDVQVVVPPPPAPPAD